MARRRGRAQCPISDILGSAMHVFFFPFPLRLTYPTFVHHHALSRADQRIHALLMTTLCAWACITKAHAQSPLATFSVRLFPHHRIPRAKHPRAYHTHIVHPSLRQGPQPVGKLRALGLTRPLLLNTFTTTQLLCDTHTLGLRHVC